MPVPRFGSVAIAIAVVSAACSGSGSDSVDRGADGNDPDPLAFADTSTTPSTQAPVEVERYTLRVAVADVGDIRPSLVRPEALDEIWLSDMAFDGLVDLDASGAVVPAIASTWEVSEDELSWTFELGQRVFTDGSPITAADVKASIERVASDPTSAVIGPSLSVIERSEDDEGVSGVVVEGPTTVRIDLVAPFDSLPELLASPVMGIEPAGVPSVDEAVIGSGRWELTPTRTGYSAVNSESDDPVERIEVVGFDERDDALAAVAGEEADLALTSSVTAADGVVTDRVFYGMNVEHPSLSDLRMREAIALTVDSKMIVAAGTTQWRASSETLPDLACSTCEVDRDTAFGLVASLKFEKLYAPVPIDVFVGGGIDERLLADELSAQLAEVGIETDVREHDIDDYADVLRSPDVGLFRYGWVRPFTGDEGWVATLFESGGADNVFGLADAGLDELIGEARRSDATYDDVALALEELRVLVPISVGGARLVLRDGVSGVELHPDATLDFSGVGVADD